MNIKKRFRWALLFSSILSFSLSGCISYGKWFDLSSSDLEKVVNFLSRIDDIRGVFLENTKTNDTYSQVNNYDNKNVIIKDKKYINDKEYIITNDDYLNENEITTNTQSIETYLDDNLISSIINNISQNESEKDFYDRFRIDNSFLKDIMDNAIKGKMYKEKVSRSIRSSIPKTRLYFEKQFKLNINIYSKSVVFDEIEYMEFYYANENPNVQSNSYMRIIGKNGITSNIIAHFVEFPDYIF